MIEEITRKYFKDTPILANVARCESRFHQFDEDGNIHRGEVNHQDVGIMQINEHYHLNQALKLGYDIYSVEGNLAYGKYLYERQGTQPWSASEKCWKNKEIAKI